MEILAPIHPGFENILTHDALSLVAKLHRSFEGRRQELLKKPRGAPGRTSTPGKLPDFLPETRSIRDGDWKIAPVPRALECRRVEITGPVERKMIINAINSGADCYMTDFEDSNSPNWHNQIQGQINLWMQSAARSTLTTEAASNTSSTKRRHPGGAPARLASG